MTPIHELVNRIMWDDEFGNADFVIGYYDRVFKRVLRVSFERIRLERGQHFGFELIGSDGEARMVPFVPKYVGWTPESTRCSVCISKRAWSIAMCDGTTAWTRESTLRLRQAVRSGPGFIPISRCN